MRQYFPESKLTSFCTVSLFTLILIFSGAGYGQEILKELNAPGNDVRGLAWDGQYLWCAEIQSGKVYQLDPSDGGIISFFNFTMDYQYGGLGWGVDDYIWLSDYRNGQSWFYKLDPATGGQISSFHCPGG